MTVQENRRRAQRVEAKLNLEVKVAQPDGSVESTNLEALNISTSGVYFRSDHFIEPMTKLAMELEVNVVTPEPEAAAGTALVPCEGLVVRVTPEAPTDDCHEYEVAVFFTHIEPEGLINLEQHIAMLLGEIEL